MEIQSKCDEVFDCIEAIESKIDRICTIIHEIKTNEIRARRDREQAQVDSIEQARLAFVAGAKGDK